VVGLGECGTHPVLAAELGPVASGERELAASTLDELQTQMLVIFDRGFSSYHGACPPRAVQRASPPPDHASDSQIRGGYVID
jgi:hypothetical protein